ncbi:nucleoside triphosphate pyrophosphohydrolase family protein [Sphingomonas soli]|uniref:nucleoside triphosphate pyrophosphohydrolase family protein n=1 Tax=Sphingomonas soli TaxID=266127 RepID=UPI000A03A0A0|nr:nucleoside triphosphate pyrophosphohydrolase family protein [Sphingomonas soli]
MTNHSLNAYQRAATRTDVSRGHDSASFLLLGLFGESGSVLAEVKKRERDRTRPELYKARVSEEVGDVLWYISAVANRNDITLSDIAALVLAKRKGPASFSSQNITFSDLQPEIKSGSDNPTLYLEWRLIDFAEASGALVAAHRKFLKSKRKNQSLLLSAFERLLSELINVCNRAGVSLEQAAGENLLKIDGRWPSKRSLPPLFDNDFPNYERLPQSILVNIIEEKLSNDNYFVYQSCNGIHIGDRLTDNIGDPDHYRFHDVFHYAYAAVLGWSPVTRALFKTKRKSNKLVDESQDGARAILIEEGISAIVFNEAKKSDFFSGVERGKLSFDLLKTIRTFVEGYEVHSTPYWVWEEAILQGYTAFRYLKEHRKGTIAVNGREITVGPLKQ